MEILGIGQAALHDAHKRASDAARRMVEDPSDAGAAVEQKQAERDAEAGARVVQTGERLFGAIIDVYA